jgi:hypothetical protein
VTTLYRDVPDGQGSTITKWYLTFEEQLPSANDRLVNGRDRKSRAIYARKRDDWAALLTLAAKMAGIPAATGKRRVTFVRIMGKRQRAFDDDDLSGGCKLVRDAMKRPHKWTKKIGKVSVPMLTAGASLIVDDGAKWIDAVYMQERAADGKPGTRIEIEDVP